MRRHCFRSCALFALVALVLGAGATVHAGEADPERIARACIRSITAISTAQAAANHAAADRCVERIEVLLENGREQAAMHLGARCIAEIREDSTVAIQRIERRSHHCIRLLLFLGAPNLALRVEHAGDQAVQRVRHSRSRAVDAIRDALS